MLKKVDQILEGTIDMHIHSGPGLISRSLNHAEACQDAMDAGMKAILLKDQHAGTANLTFLLKEYIVKDNPLKVFGGIALNNAAGGINPRVVEGAIKYGAKAVWMPTLSAKYHKEYHLQVGAAARASLPKTKFALSDPPMSIIDGNGKLLPEVKEICKMVADADIVLGNGHISKKETDLLIEEAKAQGVKKIVINHPELQLGLSIEEMKEYTKEGIYLEHILAIIYSNKSSHEYIYEMIKSTDLEYTFISSDLGQVGRPRPVEAMKKFIAAMLDLGLTEAELKTVMCDNPARLLGISGT